MTRVLDPGVLPAQELHELFYDLDLLQMLVGLEVVLCMAVFRVHQGEEVVEGALSVDKSFGGSPP